MNGLLLLLNDLRLTVAQLEQQIADRDRRIAELEQATDKAKP